MRLDSSSCRAVSSALSGSSRREPWMMSSWAGQVSGAGQRGVCGLTWSWYSFFSCSMSAMEAMMTASEKSQGQCDSIAAVEPRYELRAFVQLMSMGGARTQVPVKRPSGDQQTYIPRIWRGADNNVERLRASAGRHATTITVSPRHRMFTDGAEDMHAACIAFLHMKAWCVMSSTLATPRLQWAHEVAAHSRRRRETGLAGGDVVQRRHRPARID